MLILAITGIVVFVFCVLLIFWAVKKADGKKAPVLILPCDYGLAAQTVYLEAADGISLEGWFIRAQNSSKTIILVHGFDMNKGDILKRTYYLAKEYNLFYLDCRGSGESSGKSAFGLKENKDICATVNWLKDNYPRQSQEIGLYGLCMGAAAASYYTAVYGGVKCLLLESSFYSLKNIAKRWAWKHIKVPYFPLVSSFLFFKEKSVGQKIESFSLQETAPKITCPVLMIQGEKDKLAPVKKAQKTFALLKGPKELWVVKDAGHTGCFNAGGEEYIRKTEKFFKQYL